MGGLIICEGVKCRWDTILVISISASINEYVVSLYTQTLANQHFMF